jgi:hypothetical protein
MMKFHEYMNSKGNIAKPVVTVDGDNIDPKTPPNKPPKGETPYKCSDGKPKKAGEKGFADEGDKKLKYNPDVESPKGKAPAHIPTVEQFEAVSLLRKKAQKDAAVIENLVHHFKAHGLLGPLVAEMFEHRETYQHLSQILAHEHYGEKVFGKLSRALTEEVAKPFSDQLDDTGLDQAEMDNFDNSDQSDEEGIADDMGIDDDDMMGGDMGDPTMNADPTLGPDGPEDIGIEDPNAPDPLMGDDQNMHPALQNFQKAMMRLYQRAMMKKQ